MALQSRGTFQPVQPIQSTAFPQPHVYCYHALHRSHLWIISKEAYYNNNIGEEHETGKRSKNIETKQDVREDTQQDTTMVHIAQQLDRI